MALSCTIFEPLPKDFRQLKTSLKYCQPLMSLIKGDQSEMPGRYDFDKE